MVRKQLNARNKFIFGTIAVICVVLLYTWLSHHQHSINPKDTTMPTWSQMFAGTKQSIYPHARTGERWLLMDIKASGIRLGLGLSIAISLSVILGLTMGCIGVIQGILQPLLSFASKVTPTAILAVFFALVGTDIKMYLAMIVFGILPTLSLSIALAVRDVPEQLISKAYTLGASHLEVIFSVIAKQISPKMLDAIRLCIGPALIYLIAAEMLSSDVGFGYRIRLESRLLNMKLVYPYICFLAAFGFAADWGLRWIQTKMYPWFGKDQV